MTKHITTTLIVATYNWPEALRVCLLSIKRQSVFPDEVIIADDGSKEATKAVIDEMRKDFPAPLIHVWQPDEGFQLAKIRNRAIVKAKGDYIIQIDGDLLLHRHFINDHILFREHGFFVTGSRVLMNEELSTKILHNPEFSVSVFSKGIKNFFNGIRAKAVGDVLAKRYRSNKSIYYVKGCNMAFWRQDLIKVNGYNETFVGWGREDSEIAIRLHNIGVHKKFLKLQGIVYHIHHKEADRGNEQKNTDMMEQTIKNKITWCEKGLEQYL
jgi:glycosyltransferase involved in cell wall biosynthesis